MTNNPYEEYLRSQLAGYKKKNRELGEENERLQEKNETYHSIILQMGVVLGFGIVFATVALWVMFNG